MNDKYPHIGPTDYVAGGKIYVPRAVAIIDGIACQIINAHIDLNAHGATDKATITIPAIGEDGRDWSAQIAKDQPGVGSSAATLPKEKPITVDVRIGFVTNPSVSSTSTAQLQKIFFGLTDMYHIKSHDNELTFECRSLASVLIQDKVTTAVQNMTSVQFIELLCAKWGLQTDIRLRKGQTGATLQSVYQAHEITGMHSIAAWDVFKHCAGVDDVDLWENLGVVHYVEPGSIKRQTLAVDYGRDLEDVDINHSPWFNKNIEVIVENYTRQSSTTTWSRKVTNQDGSTETTGGTRVMNRDTDFGLNASTSSSTTVNPDDGSISTSTSSRSNSGGLFKSGPTGTGYDEPTKQRYTYYVHDYTPAQVEAYRNSKWRQISMHEYGVEFPLTITSQNLPYLDVTTFFAIAKHPNAKANDTYWPRTISIDFDIQQSASGTSNGLIAKIGAVNHRLADGEV